MVREWQVTKTKINNIENIHASFIILKDGSRMGFLSRNPKDFQKYKNIMIDEVEFRKILFSDKELLQEYEDFLESD
jgi:hypothetical protein